MVCVCVFTSVFDNSLHALGSFGQETKYFHVLFWLKAKKQGGM